MQLDYKRNLKYFKPMSLKPGIIMIVVGVLLLFAGGLVSLIGFLVAAGGGGLLYLQLAGRPTDHDIDAAAASCMRDLQEKALNKLGIDRDEVTLIEPIVVGGPYFDSLGRGLWIRQGKDRVIRSSNYEGVVIYFSEHQLHAYKFQFSLVEANERREQTDEYFYRDVVSISTQSESEQVMLGPGKDETVNYEVFRLTTSGGTSITSAMRDTAGGGTRSIQGARQLIRDRKLSSN